MQHGFLGKIGIFIIRNFNEKGEPTFKIKAKRYFRWFLVSPKSNESITYLVPKEALEEFKERFGGYYINSSVRFIGICKNGHMQDLPWEKIVHGNKQCSNKFFIWEEKRGDIAGGLEIKCEECKAKYGELFAFIHTFSHAIIRFFGEASGYSEASLRERIYFFPQEKKAGLLIFALSESGDGAAGGLISAITAEGNMNNLINYVRNKAISCSRDPVCFDARVPVEEPYFANFHGFNQNESVCHACMFISETSCELANRGLSRKVLQKYLNILLE